MKNNFYVFGFVTLSLIISATSSLAGEHTGQDRVEEKQVGTVVSPAGISLEDGEFLVNGISLRDLKEPVTVAATSDQLEKHRQIVKSSKAIARQDDKVLAVYEIVELDKEGKERVVSGGVMVGVSN